VVGSEAIDVDALLSKLRARIGTKAASVSRRVEPGALAKFSRATGQTDSRFLDHAYGPVAPLTYISTFCADGLAGLFMLDLPLATFLHTDDVAELGEPILGGDTITTAGELLDAFRKDGRRGPMLFQRARLLLTNQRDAHVATLDVSTASFA
jgi:hypothetical protein